MYGGAGRVTASNIIDVDSPVDLRGVPAGWNHYRALVRRSCRNSMHHERKKFFTVV